MPGGQRERLERRAGHAAGDGPVDLGLEVVLAAVEAAQRAGAGLDGGHRDVQLLVAEALGPLTSCTPSSAAAIAFWVNVVVTRRPPPSISSSVKPELRAARCWTMVEHVALLAAVLARSASILGNFGSCCAAWSASLGGDVAGRGHAVEDVLVALEQRALRVLAVGRVEVRSGC